MIEYGILYTGGAVLIRPNDPEIEQIYPLKKWIEVHTRNGGVVLRREITIVSDWVDVPKTP